MVSAAFERGWLVAAHLLFIPVLIYLWRRKQWLFFTFVLSSGVYSTLMHLCQIDEDYGLTSGGWCLIGHSLPENIGLFLADYVFAYGQLPMLSVYGHDVPWQQKWLTLYSTLSFNFLFVSVYADNVVPPVIISVLIFLINVGIRAYRIHKEGKSEQYYKDYVNVPCLVTAIVLLVIAGLCYLFQGGSRYWYLHSLWMGIGSIGLFFAYHVLDPAPVTETMRLCCRPPQFRSDTLPAEELQQLVATNAARPCQHTAVRIPDDRRTINSLFVARPTRI